MAIKKKAKAKSKRRTMPAKRPAMRKKTAKPARKPAGKPARKAPARRAAPKAAKPKPPSPPARPDPGERIGVVTHYYGNLLVAIVKLEAGTLRVGDTIHIRGHTSDFSQRVDSLQVEHAAVDEVGPNDEFGIKVAQHAREHDVVYKLPAS
jgi:hypothetical protein